MAYLQRNTPPPNQVLTFSLTNFVGGLNNRSETLNANQCSDVLNMAFADDTVMEKRRGTTYFDNLLLNQEVVFIDEYKPYNDTDVMIRATAKELWFGNVKIKDLNGEMTGVNFNGKYFFADGAKYYAYGKFPQATTTYEQIVGTPTPNYTLMQVTNPPNGYVALGTEHTKGRVVYDYNTRTCWYEPCVNEQDDAYKRGNVLPERPRFLAVKDGRIFASGSDRDNDAVFITDIHNPYYFPASLPMQLPPNSDRVVGMKMYNSAMVVGRRKDIYFITGMTNNPQLGQPVFRLQQINSHTGFASHGSVDVAHNYLFFLGSDGNAYALANAMGNNNDLASSVLTKTVDIFKEPVSLTKSDLWTAKSIFFEDQWYVSMKGVVLIYSYRHQAWTVYKGINARSFYEFQDILIWGNDKGMTCMPSEDHLDNGVPFKAYWKSRNFNMDDANAQKQFREFFVVAHTFFDFKSDITLTFEVDYDDVKNKIVIQNQISVWGKSKWGERFINRNINASLPFVIGRRGRNIRFTFSNGYTPSSPVATFSGLDAYLGKEEGTLVWVQDESVYYLFDGADWVKQNIDDLNQAMRIYQVNGDYEFRGKR